MAKDVQAPFKMLHQITQSEDELIKQYGPYKKVLRKSGESGTKKFRDGSDDFFHTISKAQSWAKKYKNPEEIPNTFIPDEYDFRNINGYDFTGPMRT